MKTRRDFFRSATALSLLGAANLPLASFAENETAVVINGDDRAYWVSILDKIARPVLANLARGTLRKTMPIECAKGLLPSRKSCTHLEAFGRLLNGIAPWLAAENLSDGEHKLQSEYIQLAQTALDSATNPQSPDFLNFHQTSQALVDTAFLAEAILRAPKILWKPLAPRVKGQIIEAFKSSRKIATPKTSNWTMFAALVEAALLLFDEPTLEDRLEDGVCRMLGWYLGDGMYGDGSAFHWDYYNSFVIHPSLLDTLAALQAKDTRFAPVREIVLTRARRYAAIQERLIAPDGTFPSIGRSTTYRFGAFQLLSQIAWQRELPERIKPAQVRSALTAVIRRQIEAPGTFDANGWLQIGFYGHQPALGEDYISTGSLYLCAFGLLPLGLPPTDEFWSASAESWTQKKIWAGEKLSTDHAIADVHTVTVPSLARK
ncbi:MAG TPA: DUF2264 domain-containing protein [Verrucomicrobiae bacterium]|jgi:hypothetical protein